MFPNVAVVRVKGCLGWMSQTQNPSREVISEHYSDPWIPTKYDYSAMLREFTQVTQKTHHATSVVILIE